MKIQVHSETGRLEAVIVHTPGKEVSLVNPEIREQLLFDDIIFEADAQQEHLDLIEIIRTSLPDRSQVFEICDLALETFTNDQARRFYIDELIRSFPASGLSLLHDQLLHLEPASLLDFIITGSTPEISNISLDPAPNLLFTRDLAAVVNELFIISRAAKPARIREFLLMETVVRYFLLPNNTEGIEQKTGPDGTQIHRPAGPHNIIRIGKQDSVEGGDILVVSPEIVMIGMSERTTFSGLMSITHQLLKRGVHHVIAVDIPKHRSSMHLDTIFTFASPDECIVFPPAITDRTDNISIFSHLNGRIVVEQKKSLKQTLEELLERSLTFINCGGDNITNQFREQWTDGANIFALAPGIVVGYDRNTNTFDALARHGYRIMNQHEFNDIYNDRPFDPDSSGKIAISFQGNELCRGRGGARCMTLPINRHLEPV
ncbi:MAG: arginine deiminase family protein [Balneolales bacterium]